MSAKFEGQVGIVSGGLGDIGRAIVMEFARQGADLAIGDIRDEKAASDLLHDIRTLNRQCRYDRVDVTDAEAVRASVAPASCRFP